MKFKQIKIKKFRNFKELEINFEESKFPQVFSLASVNGGGKSTLLQFIFTLLHCFSDDKKKQFIKNIFSHGNTSDVVEKVVQFKIEENKKTYYIEFYISPVKLEGINYNLFLDKDDIKNKLKLNKEKKNEFKELLIFKEEIDRIDRVSKILEIKLDDTRSFISTKSDHRLFQNAKRNKDLDSYKSYINSIINSNNVFLDDIAQLELVYSSVINELSIIRNELKHRNMSYITHLLGGENVLLIKSDMPDDILSKVPEKIYLTAPSTQIFLFLDENIKTKIFDDFSSDSYLYHSSYDSEVKATKQLLEGFFTYDFASTELILKSFNKASEADLRIKRKTGSYGSKYDELTKELKNFLEGKEISEDDDGKRVVFRIKGTDKGLSPEDLSHGELKKLSIYIWLKYIVGNDSIVLMDEVDIALHPKWQYQLINDLTIWSASSQFLLGTHSPQILSSTYYKNLIKLEKEKLWVVAKQFSSPPIDRDINSIITEVMDSPDIPDNLLKLHRKYREYFNEGKINTDEANKLKDEILEYESENSSFFQDINFEIELQQ